MKFNLIFKLYKDTIAISEIKKDVDYESLNNTSNEFTVKELLDNLMSILFNNATAINNKIEDIKVKKLNY